ncbi:replication factor C large subunit [Candidatus Woesearchaeota archaeon]|nr:replication factor C large subunit [Candidatus Woesearchaeota archaeon]
MADVWIHKYAPSSSSEVVGQNKAIEEMKAFIQDFSKQKKKSMILYGDSGSGKTSSVYAVAHELELEVIEVNASDFRTKDLINERLGKALGQMSLFAKSKVVLVDEVDGMSGTKDRGGIPAIVALIKDTKFPIFITANDPWDKKFSALRKEAEMTEFRTLSYISITNLLKHICKEEEVSYDEDDLKTIARRCGGDARAAINDLQMVLGTKKVLEKNDLLALSERDQQDSITNALMKVFKTTDPEVAITAFDNIPEDVNEVFLWVAHNLPREYKKPEDLVRAYDAISRADVFQGRIRRRQHWRYLVYVYALLSAGVATAKDEKYKGFTSYEQTKRILMLWQAKMKYEKRNSISEKIAEKTHTSKKRVIQDVLPFFKEMYKSMDRSAVDDDLELSKEEIAWLVK